jgi:hypothetical protein
MGNTHVCPPKYEVLDADNDSEWHDARVVHAFDYDDAACKYAEIRDRADAEGATERDLLVRRQGETTHRKFWVSFEYTINYSAHEGI